MPEILPGKPFLCLGYFPSLSLLILALLTLFVKTPGFHKCLAERWSREEKTGSRDVMPVRLSWNRGTLLEALRKGRHRRGKTRVQGSRSEKPSSWGKVGRSVSSVALPTRTRRNEVFLPAGIIDQYVAAGTVTQWKRGEQMAKVPGKNSALVSVRAADRRLAGFFVKRTRQEARAPAAVDAEFTAFQYGHYSPTIRTTHLLFTPFSEPSNKPQNPARERYSRAARTV